MPKIVQAKLIIGGEEFLAKSAYNVFIEMSVGGHSVFRITFPASTTEGYNGIMMSKALTYR